MFKTLLSAVVLGALASAQNCAICWDGSEAQFVSNACVCPAAVPEAPTPAEEKPLATNPNCTTGNVQACNRANGFFDFVSCTCAFPPTDAQEDWTPPEGFIDEDDEEWELEWNDYGGEYYDEYEDLYYQYTDGEAALYSFGKWSAGMYLVGSFFDSMAESKDLNGDL